MLPLVSVGRSLKVKDLSLKAKIEAVIYASEEPVTLAQLIGLLGQEGQAELDQLAAAQQNLYDDNPDENVQPMPVPQPQLVPASADEKERAQSLRQYFREIVDRLISDYVLGDRGLEIKEVAGGFRFGTKPEYHDAVRGFIKSLKPPLKLSLPALETLAVVAYKQPVTAPEITEIRGVDSGGVLGSLVSRKLITTAGRKQVIGRPILYKTTKEFLLRFGLKDLGDLPSIEEFEKMAGEFAAQEEMAMEDRGETSAELEEEREAVEPQADGDSSALDKLPVDGRISGPPPVYDRDDSSDPSAREGEIQSDEEKEEGK